MLFSVILSFIIGYVAIVFEHPLKLDKTVPALIMAALCWAFVSLGHLEVFDHHGHEAALDNILLHHIGKTAEILIFLIGAMTIVELIDLHGGFGAITDRIKTTKKSTMLWMVMPLAFFLSATLDNLACTIVVVSLLRKLVPVKEERIYFISLGVIAANAGGAWSPIGDVTTTMLWIGNRISVSGLVLALLLPSIACAIIPTAVMAAMPYMKGNITPADTSDIHAGEKNPKIKGADTMLIAGLAGLVFVPIFKTVTHLPPYVGMMLSLGVVWLISEYLHPDEEFEDKHKYSAHHALSRIEMSSILFFLGILMAVASLESLNVLKDLAEAMNGVFPSDKQYLPGVVGLDLVVAILGLGSALIDNVPLVAAAMGMYSTEEYVMDHKLWHFLAYSAGTGGSMLIIGSAAGVAAMGMEKIDFMWYMKKMAWLALLGFFAGAIVFLLMHPFVEPYLIDAASHAAPTGGGH
ncbi:sodium:proton antiporter NhaD [Saprospira grandis]|uniref:Na+/H+ antiporter n=1 Tax=Saprospira grandis (strain Lewin) TaxID=984262 RepID=H6L3T1_SAPGL|nr:sodium:proton antiporter NhaD [Saprospira grandis]AFC22766.1 putative Na+/H+ antiporter [Saprospira grandis str. Lewin]